MVFKSSKLGNMKNGEKPQPPNFQRRYNEFFRTPEVMKMRFQMKTGANLVLAGMMGILLTFGNAMAQEIQPKFDPNTPPTIFTLGLRETTSIRNFSVRTENPPVTDIYPENYYDLDVQISRLAELIRRDEQKKK